MFGFSRAVDNAAHHGHFQRLNSGKFRSPRCHSLAEMILNIAGHFLKDRTGRAAAARTGRDLRSKTSDSETLQHVLTGQHFLSPIASWQWREAHAYRVADSLLQQY